MSATAEQFVNAKTLDVVIDESEVGPELSVNEKGAVVSPRMTRDGDELRGGGLEIVKGCPLMDDKNFCRFRCCCCDNGCTKFVLMCQWFCIKCGPGGLQIEKGCPLQDEENWCRFKCLCCDSGCRKLSLECQYLCLKFVA